MVHTSPFLRIDMASAHAAARPGMQALAAKLSAAGIPARVEESEAQVMWGKLVRLNALACTTSAFDRLLGEILTTPELRAELLGAIEEGCAVAAAEGASIDAADPLGELSAAHPTLGSSMQRDIAAGRPPELDAIPGAVLRAGARHGVECPTIERLVAAIAKRVGVPAPTPCALRRRRTRRCALRLTTPRLTTPRTAGTEDRPPRRVRRLERTAWRPPRPPPPRTPRAARRAARRTARGSCP